MPLTDCLLEPCNLCPCMSRPATKPSKMLPLSRGSWHWLSYSCGFGRSRNVSSKSAGLQETVIRCQPPESDSVTMLEAFKAGCLLRYNAHCHPFNHLRARSVVEKLYANMSQSHLESLNRSLQKEKRKDIDKDPMLLAPSTAYAALYMWVIETVLVPILVWLVFWWQAACYWHPVYGNCVDHCNVRTERHKSRYYIQADQMQPHALIEMSAFVWGRKTLFILRQRKSFLVYLSRLKVTRRLQLRSENEVKTTSATGLLFACCSFADYNP